ncbi:uncharacterized protein LOC141883518 [Acropora palmata]|uniref:uncharacterized protein LOC141883518 n=1 Tax=Acropora palmata TaxID=6131 RepID=UPI003DA0C2A6
MANIEPCQCFGTLIKLAQLARKTTGSIADSTLLKTSILIDLHFMILDFSNTVKHVVFVSTIVEKTCNHPCYWIFCKHVVSEVQILINGFIFFLSIKCFMTVDGQ